VADQPPKAAECAIGRIGTCAIVTRGLGQIGGQTMIAFFPSLQKMLAPGAVLLIVLIGVWVS
jgi:hypothetical protein